MIPVVKDFDAIPPPLLKAEVLESMKLILSGDKKAMSSDLYRGKVGERFQVVEQLMKQYHSKCAYCESKEFEPQVEHYRPKNKVTGVKNSKGYFWLVYEWSNLVPTCFDCNKVGRGKGNRFPIMAENARQTAPPLKPDNTLDTSLTKAHLSPLLDEKPYLLHPEVDAHVSKCFKFSNKGRITGTDAEGRGKETIFICNLNRGNLLFRRQKTLDALVIPINDALLVYKDGFINEDGLLQWLKLVFKRFQKWGEPINEFSLFGQYSYQQFVKNVLPLIPKEYRATVKEAYNQFKAGTL